MSVLDATIPADPAPEAREVSQARPWVSAALTRWLDGIPRKQLWERRRDARIPCLESVSLGPAPGRTWCWGHLLDFSAGGMRVMVPRHLEAGTQVFLSAPRGVRGRRIVSVRVTWAARVRDRDEWVLGLRATSPEAVATSWVSCLVRPITGKKGLPSVSSRRAVRVSMVRTVTLQTFPEGWAARTGLLEDLSMTGACLSTARAPEPGLLVLFVLGDLPRRLALPARVVALRHLPDGRVRVHLKFMALAPSAERELSRTLQSAA